MYKYYYIMENPTLPIKLRKELVEKIDYLVKIGRYSNRSTAIREILEEKLTKENYFIQNTQIDEEKVNKVIQNMKKVKNFRIDLKSVKSATDLVSEGRAR